MVNDANALDLDDLDNIQDSDVNTNESDNYESTYVESENQDDDFNLTDQLLAAQGIQDKNKIKFEDESGAVVEKSWDSLSNNERLMILSHQEDPDTSLDNDEIALINQIRTSGMTPGQFVQYLQTQIQQEEPITQYEVDSMSDDELFCLDLLDKLGSDNVTDEELQQALDAAKANENLYYKQVASLRDYYKELEADKLAQDLQAEEDAKEQEYQTFADQVLNSISNFNNLQNSPVDLSQDDMENLADFMLTRDATGQTEFGKILQNPAYFTQAAFWVLNGPAIMNEMQNQIREAYLRGYNEKHKPVNKVYTSSSNKRNNTESQYAQFDEDSYLNY